MAVRPIPFGCGLRCDGGAERGYIRPARRFPAVVAKSYNIQTGADAIWASAPVIRRCGFVKRIAMLNCLKTNRVCAGAACLKAFYERTRAFERYGRPRRTEILRLRKLT